jgi:dihydroxyacid dehydratase/phosphogluconate dehydratase
VRDIVTDDAIHNAMVVHAAFGGSTNLVLHVPAIAHAAGRRRPTVDDWARINRAVPRLVDVLPNGPKHYATVQVFLAGGVPEVMLHLRAARTCCGSTPARSPAGPSARISPGGRNPNGAGGCAKNSRSLDGIDPDDVIMSPTPGSASAASRVPITFLRGNLAPEGALVKSTAIAPQSSGRTACIATKARPASLPPRRMPSPR